MRQKLFTLALTAFFTFGLCGFSFSQDLSSASISKIEKEITQIFDKSIKAGDQLDVTGIFENINDSLKTGFIDNGTYFESLQELKARFKSGIQGLEYQKMNVESKKITVLSENHVLLTAHGNYSAKVVDGRILTGKFAWTFVYSKINGKWNVIHSHMSNPRS
jgi:hypothetical protein